IEDDFLGQVLFEERTYVVAGLHSKWARRRKIELAELLNEPWSVPPPESTVGILVTEAFRRCGLAPPRAGLVTGSVHLHSAWVANGRFRGIFPGPMLTSSAKGFPPKILPVDLPTPRPPAGITSLKNRTLGPVAQLFIECAREVAKPLMKTI